MWVIYKEKHIDGKVERYYYGTYDNQDRANDIAWEMNEKNGRYPNCMVVVSLDLWNEMGGESF